MTPDVLRRLALQGHRALMVACGATALLLSACASTTSTSASAQPSPSGPVGAAGPDLGVATKTVQIAPTEFAFSPSELGVAAGSIVQWTQADDTALHNISFQTMAASQLSSPDMRKGIVWQVKFTVAGVYPYVCSLHPNQMKGIVTVTS